MDEQQSYRILNARIKNFKDISELEAPINGRSVWLVGGNSKQKTSFLQAIWCLLTNKNWPVAPIKAGADKAFIDVVVGNQSKRLVITCKITPKDKYISITDEDGAIVSKGSERTFLTGLMAPYSIEPYRFISMKPDEQLKVLKSIAGINTDAVEAEMKVCYDERTVINREVKRCKAVTDSYLQKYPEFETRNPTEKGAGSADELKLEGIEIRKRLEAIQRIESKTKEYTTQRESSLKAIERNLQQSHAIREKIAVLEREATQLVQEAEAIEKGLVEISELIEKGETWLADCNKEHWVSAEIENTTKLVALANDATKEADYQNYQKAVAEYITQYHLSQAKTDRLKELDAEKTKIISEAKIPVEGLSFNDEGLLYNGLPFDESQIARNEMLRVAILLNLAQLSEVKAVRLPDASLMDKPTREALAKVIEEKGYQAFWEIVDDEGGSLQIKYSEE